MHIRHTLARPRDTVPVRVDSTLRWLACLLAVVQAQQGVLGMHKRCNSTKLHQGTVEVLYVSKAPMLCALQHS
jgi:hypothetical protein